ncbi:MAG: sulfotransferase family protein [Gammaproteobacteria bacterium]
MKLKVIGAGLGRTGSTSLKKALEILDIAPCYHMTELFGNHPEHISAWEDVLKGKPDWEHIYAEYNAAVDWPTANYWRELATFYPEAKVVLTVRDPDTWYESVMATIYPKTLEFLQDEDPDVRARGDWINRLIWEGVFSGRIEDRAHAIDVYQQHAKAVKQDCPAERLLVMDRNFEWKPLCDFLETSVPDVPYPRANSRADFTQ